MISLLNKMGPILFLFLLTSTYSCKKKITESRLESDNNQNSLANSANTAIGLLKSSSPLAYEAALLYKSISLDAKFVMAEHKKVEARQAINSYYNPPKYNPSPYGKGQFVAPQNGMKANTNTETYTSGQSITGKNTGLINHFKSIESLNDFGTGNIYTNMRTRLIQFIVNEVDKKNPAPTSETKRVLLDYIGPDLYRSALDITDGNVFKAVTLLADLGHDDYQSYGLQANSNLFARGVLGEKVLVPRKVHDDWKRAGEELNSRIPKNGQDIGGTYNYQMIAGFYMGCQLSKLGLSPIKVNKKLVDSILAIGLRKYYGGNGYDKCISDFFKDRKCTQQGSGNFLFTKALSEFTSQYELNLATDLPALGGYYYKVATLEIRLNSSGLLEVPELFKAGYINPFMENFPKPPQMDPKKFEDAKLFLNARLLHVQYVLEQHKAGATFGAQVCAAYKEKISKELKLTPMEKALFDMGFMQVGIRKEHVLRRADAKLRIPKLIADEKALEMAINGLNQKLFNNFKLVDWIMPDVSIMERAIEIDIKKLQSSDDVVEGDGLNSGQYGGSAYSSGGYYDFPNSQQFNSDQSGGGTAL